jgi:hypothetical protein
MADDFYNPYQFIPATGLGDDDARTVAFDEIKEGRHAYIRHDLWSGEAISGRIVCSVTLETPTVVGNIHTPPANPNADEETKVDPYKVAGEYALPANSLRGMVASVAETISQSALRVLEEEVYSVRKDRSEGLSAIGMIRPHLTPASDEVPLGIVPLSLPTTDLNETHWKIPDEWIALFRGRSLSSCLGAYVNGYYKQGSRLQYVDDSFLRAQRPDCFHQRRPVFYWAKINAGLSQKTTSDRLNHLDGLHITNGFLLGQYIDDPITEEQFNRNYPNPDDPERLKFQRGIMHVLGIDRREGQIPAKQKKHERFIPVLDDLDTLQPIPITKTAWDDFMAVAAHRADSSKKERIPAKRLPFLPKSYLENKESTEYWKPEVGELVYFKLENGRATEISYTSIWRKAKAGNIHTSFGKINKNLLPWGFGGRTHLTPAERIFGVVHGKEKVIKDAKSHNLASRVRFSDARKLSSVELLRPRTQEDFQLKILASPKPPSPAMYFQDGPTKRGLDLNSHKPNGRKYYLPHDPDKVNIDEDPPWESRLQGKHKTQKIRCCPFKESQTFYFHIDFDNLADAELGLLLTALSPDRNSVDGFVHRLGLGKPLGLGSVTVRVGGVFLIDRVARYGRNALDPAGHRYSDILAAPWQNVGILEAASGLGTCPSPAELSKLATVSLKSEQEQSLVDSTTLELLKKVGNRNNQNDLTIHYPYCIPEDAGADFEPSEEKGYEWFVQNDRSSQRQNLKPVPAGANQKLPSLTPYASQPHGGKRPGRRP